MKYASKRIALIAAPVALGLAACAPMPIPTPEGLGPVNGLGANGDSFQSSVADGARFVAFASNASNLVSGDTNGATDIFVKDRTANTLNLISVGVGNVPANGGSSNPTISDDGTRIVFESDATNLTAGDSNGASDVFAVSGGIIKNLTGAGNGTSTDAMVSGDGSTVVFQTFATNLVGGDTNGTADIATVPFAGGLVSPVSSTLPNDYSEFPSISDNGTKVTFGTFATNIGGGATNSNIVVATGGVVTPVVVTVPNGYVRKPAISGDGTTVAFESSATNLFAGDTNGNRDIVLASGGTARAATAIQGNGDAADPVLTDNGSMVAFSTTSSNFTPADTNGVSDIVFAIGGGVTWATRASVGDGDAGEPALDSTGQYLTFSSAAINLVTGDTNGFGDVFQRDTYN